MRIKKQEGIVALVVLRVRDIIGSNVLLCHDGEDIAFVASINHTPKVWIIHVPSSKWLTIMQLPICTIRNYMQTCHEGIQNVAPIHS